ncbi:hypothetical protein K431DRAFT_286667 [Polychaeton citri CBS 116435]|uniref:Uncharacterized protein n=1 Tax=Polychaeton citri CBS 116435 TaxID=1314669 RepID=A0A9P4Q2T6_9PEZI|nr:hypothetical protein K431DRAFT_286667 [Polychaeton citri CBS 116435]
MGLPIWRDPDEDSRRKSSGTAQKQDATAHARSPIRRYPSIHGRQYPRLTRQHSIRDPNRDHAPYQLESLAARSVSDVRETARGSDRRVPPISVLLESADSHEGPRHPDVLQRRMVDTESTEDLHNVTPGGRLQPQSRSNGARRLPQNIDRQLSENDPARASRTSRYQARGILYPRTREERDRFRPARDIANGPDAQHPRGLLYRGRNQARYPGQIVDGPLPEQPQLMPPEDGRGRMFRSPEPLIDLGSPERPRLPTPPRDWSTSEAGYAGTSGSQARPQRLHHPLSHSWRPESPINGLGDRARSPSSAPGDGWEVMRSTIEPDRHLPSADSSFTSAAASNSFSSNDDTHITVPSNDNESLASVDADDLVCADDDLDNAIEAFAEDVYYHENSYEEGQDRVEQHRARYQDEGNRFARYNESVRAEIGFRLIEEAIDTEEGRERLSGVRRDISFDDAAFVTRNRRLTSRTRGPWARRSQRENLMDAEIPSTNTRPLSPVDARRRQDSSRESTPVLDTPMDGAEEGHLVRSRHDGDVRSSTRTEGFIERFDQTPLDRRRRTRHRASRLDESPERFGLGDVEAEADISTEAPQPHPVSPPTARSSMEVADALVSSGGESGEDLDSARRIIERMAQRDDIPEEWWMGMGLNLSRTAPGAMRRRPRAVDIDGHVVGADGVIHGRSESRSARGSRL